MFSSFLDSYYDVENQVIEYLKRKALEYFEKVEQERRSIQTIREFEIRRKRIKDYFLQTIGGLDFGKKELFPIYTGIVEKKSFLIKKVIFQSLPKFYVTANLYMPKKIREKLPAILFASGHFMKAKSAPEYQKVCIDLVNNGFIVLSVDPIGQGERMQYYDKFLGRALIRGGIIEHSYAGFQNTLIGSNIARYFIWDLVRAVDFLESLPEVDSERIGMTGNSGGGTQTLYMMLIEPRIKVAVPCTVVTSIEEYMKTGQAYDSEQNIFGAIREGLDYDDYIASFAPKPVMIGAVESDYFCIEGTIVSYDRAKKVYKLYGKEDNIKLCIVEGTHSYNDNLRIEAVKWFVKHLKGKNKIKASNKISIEEDKTLICTKSGQVLGEFEDAKSVFNLNFEYFKKNCLKSRAEDLKSKLLEVLNLPKEKQKLYPRIIETSKIRDILYKKLFFFSEKDIITAGVYFTKEGSKICTILLLDEGTNKLEKEKEFLDQFLDKGEVFVFDPRGIGSVKSRAINSCDFYDFYGTEFKLNFDFMKLGTSLTALRVYDVVRACDYIEKTCPEKNIHIAGKGIGAIYALFASVIDDRIKEIYLEDLLYSFEDIVSSKYFEYDPRLEIYGIVKYFDIPELLSSLKDRKIICVNFRNGRKELLRGEKLEELKDKLRNSYITIYTT